MILGKKGDTIDALPAMDSLLDTCIVPITWVGASEFIVTSAALNGCLQLGGDPQFILDEHAQVPSAPRGLHIAMP